MPSHGSPARSAALLSETRNLATEIGKFCEQSSIVCRGIQVWYSDFLSSTPHYSRWEDKPDFQRNYKKPVGKKIRKVTPEMVKYMTEIHYDY